MYLLATGLGISLLVISNLYIGDIAQVQTRSSCSTTECVAGILAGLAGYFLSFTGGMAAVVRYLTQEGYIRRQSRLPDQPGFGTDDEKILGMADELVGQMVLPRIKKAGAVGWSESLTWHEYGFKRQGRGKPPVLLLSAGLRGRLLLEDWKTMLTYYFLRDKPRMKMMLGTFFKWMGALLLLPTVGVVVASIYGILGGRLYAQLIAGPAALLILIWVSLSGKKLFLKLDRIAAASVGTNILLDCFRKVEGFGLLDVDNEKKRKGWFARVWLMPTMSERIQNLESVNLIRGRLAPQTSTENLGLPLLVRPRRKEGFKGRRSVGFQ